MFRRCAPLGEEQGKGRIMLGPLSSEFYLLQSVVESMRGPLFISNITCLYLLYFLLNGLIKGVLIVFIISKNNFWIS